VGKSRKEKDSKQTETERGGGGEIAKTGEAKEAEEYFRTLNLRVQ
jgi:hypothetical protein